MINFIINRNKHYFYLHNSAAMKLNPYKLSDDCQVFDNMTSFYEAVAKLFPEIDDIDVLIGSYIELYLDEDGKTIVLDHNFIDGPGFPVDGFEKAISDYSYLND